MPPSSSADAGPGLALARDYFLDVVEPLLARECRDVPYAAARLGQGSEVLGLDDVRSQDHDWGLRLQVFVTDSDVPTARAALEQHLPDRYHEHPTRLTVSGGSAARLGVEVTTPSRFAHARLGFDPTREVTLTDWLSVSGQAALEVVAGQVFRDDAGDLTKLRETMSWYPGDVWRYVVASDWQRVDQELPLLARAGERGDDLGSRTITARLVEVVIHLAFMLSLEWPPYAKWRGSRFAQLAVAAGLADDLDAALSAGRWQDRSESLRRALEMLGDFQVSVGLPAQSPAVVPFWDRPHLHVAPAIVTGLMDSIAHSEVRALPVGAGGIDQRTDNVDVLMSPQRRAAAVAGAGPVVHG